MPGGRRPRRRFRPVRREGPAGAKMIRMNWSPRALARSIDGPGSRRLPRRLVQLFAGLVLYGITMGMLVRAELGVIPWDVLHQGLSRQFGLSMGTVVIVVSVLLLLLWIPLRERPGLGTLSNAVVVGLVLDATLAVLPPVESLPLRVLLVLAGVLLNAVATAAYIGVHLGPGPRDGLMTGLARRTGLSLRLVRTALEVAVVVIGLLLGGVLGVGTVVYALAIGPLTQLMLPWFTVDLMAPRER